MAATEIIAVTGVMEVMPAAMVVAAAAATPITLRTPTEDPGDTTTEMGVAAELGPEVRAQRQVLLVPPRVLPLPRLKVQPQVLPMLIKLTTSNTTADRTLTPRTAVTQGKLVSF